MTNQPHNNTTFMAHLAEIMIARDADALFNLACHVDDWIEKEDERAARWALIKAAKALIG